MENWRLLDTGQRTADENIALDHVLLKAKNINHTPNTIRFLQFKPHAVLLGYHQSPEQELRVDFCKQAGIDINRRITGGGTIFFDETQIGWEIICEKKYFDISIADPGFFLRLSLPLIKTLEELGLNACFRPRNDIEINKKKISGTGGTEEGDVFLFQGTLLVDFDIVTMIKALRIPIEKLKDKEIDEAKERVTCLKWELGYTPDSNLLKNVMKTHFEETFDIVLEPERLTFEEKELFEQSKKTFRSKTWVNKVSFPKNEQHMITSIHKAEGGLIRTSLMINQRFNRIQSAFITGDFFAYPKRIIVDLEAELKDTLLDINTISNKISDFFKRKTPIIPGVQDSDFIIGIRKTIEKLEMTKFGIPLYNVNRIHTVNGSFPEIIKNSPKHLLLPYCSKSLDCGYRYKRDCLICGNCSIGEAFESGKAKEMWVTTILNFEDLINTLDRFQSDGVNSYIGCCCEAFYIKHLEDFEKSQVPGILIDIDNTTCFDLRKQQEAYNGTFDRQTMVNIDLLKRVLNARRV
ncbi:MAG: DUF116 domain-containing protein [Candidatus Thermoplasmatota archaeon]|nr:DUF116 domain-containing protein [Candidatus Thermoplasmatota archaeon]